MKTKTKKGKSKRTKNKQLLSKNKQLLSNLDANIAHVYTIKPTLDLQNLTLKHS